MMKDEIAQQSEESKDSMIGVKDKSMEKKHVWGGGGTMINHTGQVHDNNHCQFAKYFITLFIDEVERSETY